MVAVRRNISWGNDKAMPLCVPTGLELNLLWRMQFRQASVWLCEISFSLGDFWAYVIAWLVLWWIGCFLLATGIQKGCHSHAQLEIMFENMVFICWKIEFEILTYSPNTPTQKLDPWRTRIYTLQNDPGIYGFRYHSEQCQRKQWRYYLYLVILVRS